MKLKVGQTTLSKSQRSLLKCCLKYDFKYCQNCRVQYTRVSLIPLFPLLHFWVSWFHLFRRGKLTPREPQAPHLDSHHFISCMSSKVSFITTLMMISLSSPTVWMSSHIGECMLVKINKQMFQSLKDNACEQLNLMQIYHFLKHYNAMIPLFGLKYEHHSYLLVYTLYYNIHIFVVYGISVVIIGHYN